MDIDVSFGRWVALRRKAMRLSQGELARQASCATITIRKIEEDARHPSQQLAESLAKQLAVSPQERETFVQVARGERSVDRLSPPDRLAGSVPRDTMNARGDNLPIPPTRLIGRAEEVATVRDYLLRPYVRLLTLVGTPGIGKTRLALQVAAQVAKEERDVFTDGVWFVPLAPISEPELVAVTIAQTLGVAITPGAPPLESVTQHVQDRSLLLVLDNFEHVREAAPGVAELIAAAPQLKVLVTSRAALRLSAEHLYEVPPLAAPPAKSRLRDHEEEQAVMAYPAVELFVQRAQAVKHDFALTADNGVVIGEMCRRLDGLPLAIELAAARLRLFSPQVLLARLASSANGIDTHSALDVLTDGPRDLPLRQRTLRNAIQWSYDLLTPEQQRLLRCLGAFVGGCTLEAAQAVAGDPPSFITDLQALLDSSLIQRNEGSDGEARFTLLETIREYALEQLAACGDADAVRERHAAYFLALVQVEMPSDIGRKNLSQPCPKHYAAALWNVYSGSRLRAWFERVRSEYDNLRTALSWSLADAQNPEVGVDLAIWLFSFWYMCGSWSEAVHWLECALTQIEPSARTQQRANLLGSLAGFIGAMGNSERARRLAQEALSICRELQDPWDILNALINLTDVELERGNVAEAQVLAEEWLAISISLRAFLSSSNALYALGDIALTNGDSLRAAALLDESLTIAQDLDKFDVMPVLNFQGNVACYQGDYARATVLCREALMLFQAAGFKHGTATTLHSLGDIALFQGDTAQARSLFEEGLLLFRENSNKQRSTWCLAGLAAVAATNGQAGRAATLWSAAEGIRASIGNPRPALRHKDYCERVDGVRRQLDERALNAAIAAGRTMSLDQAVDCALQDE